MGIHIRWPDYLQEVPGQVRNERIAQEQADRARVKKDLNGRYAADYKPTPLEQDKIAALQLALSIIYDKHMPFRVRKEIGKQINEHPTYSKLLMLNGAGVRYADILESVMYSIEQDLPIH